MKQSFILFLLLASGCSQTRKGNEPITPQATGPEIPPSPSGPTAAKPRLEARDPVLNRGARVYDNTLNERVDPWPLSDEEVAWIPFSAGFTDNYYSDSTCNMAIWRGPQAGCAPYEAPKYAVKYVFNSTGWLTSQLGQVVKAYASDGSTQPSVVYQQVDGVCSPLPTSATESAWFALKEIPLSTFAKNRVEKRVSVEAKFAVPVIVSDSESVAGTIVFGLLDDLDAGSHCYVNPEKNGVCEISANAITPVYDSDTCASLVSNALYHFDGQPLPTFAFDGETLHQVTVTRQFNGYWGDGDVCEEDGSSYLEVTLGNTVQQRSVPLSSEPRGQAEERFATVGDSKIPLGYFASNAPCYADVDSAGTPRCIPPTTYARFADAACTQAIARGGQLARVPDACGATSTREVLAETVPAGVLIYEMYKGTCSSSTNRTAESHPYFRVGGVADFSKYPRMN
jgi:hypothetical protein